MRRFITFITRAGLSSVAALAVVAVLSSAQSARAANFFWKDSVINGNWNTGTNWSAVANSSSDNAGVPGASATVKITPDDGLAHTITYNYNGSAITLTSLAVDVPSLFNACTLSMAANTLTSNIEYVGGFSGSLGFGFGTFNQSGGTNTAGSGGFSMYLGYNSSDRGLYNLSGTGILNTNVVVIGNSGTGTFTQSGGSHTLLNFAGNTIVLGFNSGSHGIYTLTDGYFQSTGFEAIGYFGSGTFNQSGGTHTVTSGRDIDIGLQANSSGTFNLNGGTAAVSRNVVVGGDVNAAGGAGVLNVSDSGDLSIVGTLLIYNTPGNAVNLSGGAIHTAALNVKSNPARFNWTGGTLDLTSGITFDPAAAGTTTSAAFGSSLVLGGNQALLVTGSETLGGAGAFSLTLNGANHTVTGGITISPGSTMTLNGSAITAAGLNVNGLPSRFNWIGGTFNLTTSVTFDSAADGTTTSAAFGPALVLGSNQTLIIGGDESLGGAGAFDLTLNSGSTHNVTGGITLNSTGTFTQNAASTLTYSTFTQSGGTVNGALQNQTTFIYQSGTFNGRLLNQGSVSFGSSFTLGNGIENDTAMTVAAGQTLTLNGAGLDNQGTFTLAGGTLAVANMTSSGSFVFDSGTLTATQAGGTISASIISNTPNTTININADNVSIGNPASFTGFNHQGILNVGASAVTLNSAGFARLGILTSLAGGTINAPNGVALATGSNFLGNGTVTARVSGASGSIIEANGALALGDAASPAGFNFGGELHTKQFAVTLNASGPATLGSLTTLGSGAIAGTLNAANGFVVDFGDAVTGFGTINSTNALAKRATINGTVQGDSPTAPITLSGWIKGTGTFNNVTFSGTYDPGFSPTLATVGSISFSPTGALNIELGGTSRAMPTQYDVILASGTLSLAGTLKLSLINSFTPVRGNKFDILDWSSLSGAFSSLQLPALASPLRWNVGQLYADGTLSVIDSNHLPGDFNRDTQVTAADIPVMLQALTNVPGYETQYGVSDSDLLAIGDFDNSGAFTNADMQGLLYLLSHGGIVLGSPSPAASVPEPTAVLMLGSGTIIVAWRLFRRFPLNQCISQE